MIKSLSRDGRAFLLILRVNPISMFCMKLRMLAIETSTEACSCSYQNEEGEFFTLFEIIPQQHTRRLFPMIREVLAMANANLSSVDAIAVSQGPGSFTGVRIAISVSQGLGFGLNKPLYPVSTLAAMAFQERKTLKPEESKEVKVVLDARMGEYYVGNYLVSARSIVPLEDDHLTADLGFEVAKIYPNAEEVGLIAQLSWEKGNQGVLADEVIPIYLREKVVG